MIKLIVLIFFAAILYVVADSIAMSMIGACYIPQIYKLYETKNADSQSLAFWVMLSVGLLANVYISRQSALIGGGWSMFIIQVINGSLAIWVLVLVFIYQKRRRS